MTGQVTCRVVTRKPASGNAPVPPAGRNCDAKRIGLIPIQSPAWKKTSARGVMNHGAFAPDCSEDLTDAGTGIVSCRRTTVRWVAIPSAALTSS
jgi:hypothetical protein